MSLFFNTITGAWFLLSTISAGIGAIYLMRWFWWRINAWTEIVCLGFLLLYFTASEVARACGSDIISRFEAPFPINLLYLVPLSVGTGFARHVPHRTGGEGEAHRVRPQGAARRPRLAGDRGRDSPDRPDVPLPFAADLAPRCGAG